MDETAQDTHSLELFGENHAEVPGLQGHPVNGRSGGDARGPDETHAVVNEEEHLEPPEQHGFAATSGYLSRRMSFALLVSIAVTFLAASSAPTPLYAVYEATWHFSPITLTVVFAVYAIAVLGALLTVGSLSDHIGRRPVLLAAILLQVAALSVFATASGVPALLVARIIQGFATGGALGAVGAGLLDLDKVKGTIVSGVGTVSGTAFGALVSGLMVQFWPAPTRLIYVALLGMFVLEEVGVALMGETSTKKVGAVASLRPHLAWPRAARAPLLIATPILVAIWALAGLYASLGPTIVRLLTGSGSVALGGLSLFALALSGALTALLANKVSNRTVLFNCTVMLIVGAGVIILAVAIRSTTVFFLGTVVAGIGFGFGFQGAMRSVLPLVKPHERAGVLSTIYLLSYLAFGLPVVAAGCVVAHGVGVLPTAKAYGTIVIALAVVALFAQVVQHRRPTDDGGRPDGTDGRSKSRQSTGDLSTMEVLLIGRPTALIEINGLRFLTDPTFDPPVDHRVGERNLVKTRGRATTFDQIQPIDVVLLSHDQHPDNLDHAGRRLLSRRSRGDKHSQCRGGALEETRSLLRLGHTSI